MGKLVVEERREGAARHDRQFAIKPGTHNLGTHNLGCALPLLLVGKEKGSKTHGLGQQGSDQPSRLLFACGCFPLQSDSLFFDVGRAVHTAMPCHAMSCIVILTTFRSFSADTIWLGSHKYSLF